MSLFNSSRLQTLFWEIKNRSFYVFFSFFLSFVIAYQNAKSLLYIFVLSYGSGNETEYLYFSKLKDRDFTDLDSILSLSIDTASINFIFTDIEEAFSNVILISTIFSLVSVMPFLLYEVFSFFSASLYLYERKKWLFRLFGVVFFWCLLVYNVQYLVIPKLAEFLLFFQISSSAFSLSAETKISSYCSWANTIWIVSNLLFFGVVSLFFVVISQLSNCSSSCFTGDKKESNRFRSKPKVEGWIFSSSSGYNWCKKRSFVRQRKIHAIISILTSSFIAPPEAIQIVLALLFFFSAETCLYIFKVINHSFLKTESIDKDNSSF